MKKTIINATIGTKLIIFTLNLVDGTKLGCFEFHISIIESESGILKLKSMHRSC